MRLRKKIFIFLFIIATTALGATYLFLHLIFLDRFARIDEAAIRIRMNDISQAYQERLEGLKTSLLNYSVWDETVDYVTSGDSPEESKYIDSNYDVSTYETNRYNAIVLLDARGQIRYGGMHVPGDSGVRPLSGEIKDLISANRYSLTFFRGPEDGYAGLLMLKEGPWMVTYLPIVSNELSGPVAGTAIAARMLDEEETKAIGRLSPNGIRIRPASSASLPEKNPIELLPGSRIGISQSFKDVFGGPGIVISMEQPRQIYESGKHSVLTFSLVFFLNTVIICLATMVFVNRSILGRMSSLMRSIRNIGSSQDLSIRIEAKGNDEFTEVGHEFNRMIASLEQAQQELRLQGMMDPLTQLPNRSLFFNKLNAAISEARESGLLIVLLFIDLDNFKTINDTWGHDYGDMILKEIAARLSQAVGPDDVVSRLGGDEFTLLLSNIQERGDIPAHIAEIQEALRVPHQIDGHLFYNTASIGVSVYPTNGQDADLLVKQADLAMLHVKESGRAHAFEYSAALEESIRRRKVLGRHLMSAADRGELRVHYQPILSAHTMEVVKVEALLRWNSSLYGPVAPSEFIPIAEAGGSIVRIGEWLVRQVCRDLRQFHDQGLRIRAAVNISAVQLQLPGLLETLLGELSANGLLPSALELEITESLLMSGEEINGSLQELRRSGFHISLDDFGTGFSSLSYLRHFPVDVIKIDRSFISELAASPSDKMMVKSIIELVHNLGLTVVSEGVEEREQFDILKQLGSDEIQGYWISRPQPCAEMITFLSQYDPLTGQ